MRREGRQVMGRVDYILRLDQDSFSKVGVREARLHTDHNMALVVI